MITHSIRITSGVGLAPLPLTSTNAHPLVSIIKPVFAWGEQWRLTGDTGNIAIVGAWNFCMLQVAVTPWKVGYHRFRGRGGATLIIEQKALRLFSNKSFAFSYERELGLV